MLPGDSDSRQSQRFRDCIYVLITIMNPATSTQNTKVPTLPIIGITGRKLVRIPANIEKTAIFTPKIPGQDFERVYE